MRHRAWMTFWVIHLDRTRIEENSGPPGRHGDQSHKEAGVQRLPSLRPVYRSGSD